MTSEKKLGYQVKHLLSNLSDHGAQHLTEIETDLAQIGFLLGEAIGKLNGSFMSIHDCIASQQEAIEKLLSSGRPSAEIIDELNTQRAEIDRHVNAAVTGLQFQDMTSQLIGRTAKRVTGLRDVLDGVGAESADMGESNIEEIVAKLSSLNARLEEQSVKLESTLWKAVCQTHMESGDIELF